MRKNLLRKKGCMLSALMLQGFVLAAFCTEPKMYLCSDSSAQTKSKDKLVYGYIDGKKTACMSEYEFLALYGKTVFDKDSAARAQKEQEAVNDAKAKAVAASEDELVKKIRGGKKDLDGVDMMGLNLAGMNLSGASMKSADLRNANLSNANLTGAVLEAAFLRKANLQQANLTAANLRGAYFVQADLRGAKGLTIDRLKEAKTFYKARLDSEVLAVLKAELPRKLNDPKKCWENNAWSDNEDCKPSASKPRPR